MSEITTEWDYPIFISYPRTGSHFLNYMMEIYFNRPRLRISHAFAGQGRGDYMWVHDHDIFCKNKRPIYFYMYRQPKDVIFSNVYYEHKKNGKKSDVLKIVKQYREHLIYYVKSGIIQCKQYVRYENFVDHDLFPEEFSKICKAFDKEFDKERSISIRKETTKEKMVEVESAVYKRKKGLLQAINTTKDYKDYKEEWENEYAELIESEFSELASLFGG